MRVAFYMIDVFGQEAFTGNPLAVVVGADILSAEEMLRLTHWFNLSETTFLLPPTQAEADYRVRIFAPEGELPFAGHPTLGTCCAWLAAGNMPRNPDCIVQECGAGLVPIRRLDNGLSFAAPALIRSGSPTADELAEAQAFLGIEPDDIVDAAWVDNGPGWLGIRLVSSEKVLTLSPSSRWPRRIDVGVVGPHATGSDTAVEVRAFFTDQNGATCEDPVTGSLNASIGQWLFSTGIQTQDYVAAQGTRLGRKGRVFVSRDDNGQVWVGGEARVQVEGSLNLA